MAAGATLALGEGAAQGVTTVDLHRRALPPSATVWCISHPARMGTTARAEGVHVGGHARPVALNFGNPPERLGTWANDARAPAPAQFERTCRTAFFAFSNAGLDVVLAGITPADAHRAILQVEKGIHGGGDTGTGFSGLVGVLLGSGLTAAGGAITLRRKNRKDDGDALRKLEAEFRAAFEAYLSNPEEGSSRGRARVSAGALQDALAQWSGRSTEAQTGARALKGLLDSSQVPYIGNLGGADRTEVREIAASIRTATEGAAEYIEDFKRVRSSKSSEIELPTQSRQTDSSAEAAS